MRLLLLAAALVGVPAGAAPHGHRVIHRVVHVAPMPAARFWAIIDRTTVAGNDQDAQLRRLRAELAPMKPAELIAFQSRFDDLVRRAYRWDLWGAGFIIDGGMSDDSFEYFRCWLIGRGQSFYDAAVAYPDALADMLPARVHGPLDFETLALVAPMAWSTKTGDPAQAMPRAPAAMDADPVGTRFETDEDSLAARYPRLWKRFGDAPLG